MDPCAHNLRDLEAVVEHDGEPWAAQMQHLLRRALQVTELARGRGGPVPSRLVDLIQRRYDDILDTALHYHAGVPPLPPTRRGRRKRRPGHNLAMSLHIHRAPTLRFLTDLTLPTASRPGPVPPKPRR